MCVAVLRFGLGMLVLARDAPLEAAGQSAAMVRLNKWNLARCGVFLLLGAGCFGSSADSETSSGDGDDDKEEAKRAVSDMDKFDRDHQLDDDDD